MPKKTQLETYDNAKKKPTTNDQGKIQNSKQDQSAADNNWGNTAPEFVRYESNTFEYMYVKR